MPQPLQILLAPPGASALWFSFALLFFIALVLLLSMLASWRQGKRSAFWVGGIFGAGLLLVVATVTWSAFDRQVLVTNSGLQIRAAGFLIDEQFDRTLLRGAQVQILKRAALGDREPVYRIKGIGMPGLASGWFRCKDKQTAFVVSGAGENILVIETGRARFLVDVAEPENARQQLAALLRINQ